MCDNTVIPPWAAVLTPVEHLQLIPAHPQAEKSTSPSLSPWGVMALGERGYVPSSQQSPFSCANLLFSASFQEEETHSRTHAAHFSSGLYKRDHQRCSHTEPSPAPTAKPSRSSACREAWWGQTAGDCGGEKQVKEKLLLFLCVLQQGVCAHTSPRAAVTLSLFRSNLGQSTGPDGGSVLSNETSKAVPFCCYLFQATPKCPIRAVHLCMMNSLAPRLP